jgi:hypothetical protein
MGTIAICDVITTATSLMSAGGFSRDRARFGTTLVAAGATVSAAISSRVFLAGHQVDSLLRHHLGLPHYLFITGALSVVLLGVRLDRSAGERAAAQGPTRSSGRHARARPSRRQRPRPTVHRLALMSAHKAPRPRARPTTRSRARPRLHSPRCHRLRRNRHGTALKAHDGRPGPITNFPSPAVRLSSPSNPTSEPLTSHE